MTTEPHFERYEYQVRAAIHIPLLWAECLRELALNHYDSKCRESGNRGVINALYNVARWNEEESGSLTTHPVNWSDLDLICKVLEMSPHVHDYVALGVEIRVWAVRLMSRINAEWRN